MKKYISRRDLLKLAGGSAVGLLFTPVIWKALDDTAIWTQNWSLIPPLQRGPVTFKYSACTLCPAGCAIRARCVGGNPVSLSGLRSDPISHGILCPMGLAGHHMAYHPLRLHSTHAFTSKGDSGKLMPLPRGEAIARIAESLKSMKPGECIAVLDQQPNRAISFHYQRFIHAHGRGLYLTPPARECTTLTSIAGMTGLQAGELGFDYEATRLVVSFGAPLLDGWGTPGRLTHLLGKHQANRPRLIQVESRQSRTALQADSWIPVRPGTEGALALGIAHCILNENGEARENLQKAVDGNSYLRAISDFNPTTTSELTGVDPQVIEKMAQTLIRTHPSIVIAGCDPAAGPLGYDATTAVAGLNLLLGNVGRSGGVTRKSGIPSDEQQLQTTRLTEVPDHSIALLILDGAESGYAVPWQLVEQKLVQDNGLMVSLSPFVSGLAAHADFIIPSPAPFEGLRETAGATDQSVATYALSSPLLPSSEGTTEPAEFIAGLSDALGLQGFPALSNGELIRNHLETVLQSGRGKVVSTLENQAMRTEDVQTVENLEHLLTNGSVWMDDPIEQNPPKAFSLLGHFRKDDRAGSTPLTFRTLLEARNRDQERLLLIPVGWRGAVATGQVAPVLSKLFQESELRENCGVVLINPGSAREHTLVDGGSATITTSRGSRRASVRFDEGIMPGVLFASVGPSRNGTGATERREGDILQLCAINSDGSWRITEANIVRA